MQLPDEILVQKCLSATLAKVAAMKKNLDEANKTLKKQEALLASSAPFQDTQDEPTAVAPLRSPSILDGDVDMSQINEAIKRLAKGCDCPALENSNFSSPPKGT